MPPLELNKEEVAIVVQCLHAAAEGPFFPEWEFHTLIGLSRDEVRQLAARWSAAAGVDDGGKADADAAITVLNNLVGYPHGQESVWPSFISVGRAGVSALLEKMISQRRGGR